MGFGHGAASGTVSLAKESDLQAETSAEEMQEKNKMLNKPTATVI